MLTIRRLALLIESVALLATPAVWRDPYAGTTPRLATIVATIPDPATERITRL